MDGMNCVARRTRRKWDDFYEKRYHEMKGSNLKSDTIVVDEAKHDFVGSSEMGCDGAGEVEKEEKGGNEGSCDFDFPDEKKLDGSVDIDGDGVLEGDGVGVLGRNQCEDDGVDVEILSSDDDHGDDGFGILKNDGDDELDDGDDDLDDLDDDGGILEIGEDEFNGVGILKKDERVDDGLESLESDEDGDDGIELLKTGVEDDGDGVDSLKSDGDEDNNIELVKSEGEDDDDGVERLKSDEEEDDGVEMLKSGGAEDGDGGVDSLKSDGDEDNGIEMLKSGGEDDGGGVESLKSDEEEDNSTEMLKSGGEDDVDGENREECSREKAQIDSETEDSESERTSEEEEDEEEDKELSDVDYEEDESSTSESSDKAYHGENENLMKGAEEKLPDTVEDRKESDIKQEKNDESDEDDQQIFNDKEKSTKIRKSGGELERDDKIDEEEEEHEKKRTKFSSVEHSARTKQKKVPNESASNMEEEHKSWTDDVNYFFTQAEKTKVEKGMFSSKKFHSTRDLDLIKILVDSINSVEKKLYTIDEKALAENSLPLKFKFEEEVAPPPEKSEWEKHVDLLFCDLDMGLREVETDCTENSKMENESLKTPEKIDESPAASCRRGNHQPILDEQIGIVCEFCGDVIMDIKYILPPFHTPTRDRRDRKAYYYDESPSSFFSDFQFQGSASSTTDSMSCTYGTVWDLIPGVKKDLYPHQREGFEFMWKNIAGGIIIEKLKQTLAEDARGCIISHAPGTGKTRLTIVFLQSFLKMYPTCSPMIIAPRVMLRTWEDEFIKWNFNIAFHNLSEKELCGKENAVAAELLGQVGSSGALSIDCTRLLKLYSWARGGSILGISYQLFKKLAGENGETQQHEKIREVLLQRPGLLVLDEGHTPRNEKSQIWKVLKKVSTQRRIILSGTPFQNSLQELSNTLCVANPKFANQVGHRKYGRLTRSSDINRDEAMKLKAILAPYVHVHKGTILKESLPGLRHTLLFLHPTECQKILLKSAWMEKNFLRRNRMISLVSVHPSIDGVMEGYPGHRSKLEEIKLDVDAGVKTRFLMKLIHFCDALGERVLVFSQFIDSLMFIKEQLVSNFSWNAGREVLYMDGQLDDRRRQDSISSFNDDASEAKVLLASVKACSEGINLVGASRVVLLDTLWNPSVEKQAICRAYRIGQKKVVHVYRLFTTGVEVRLGQFPCQLHKEQVSRLLFSLGEEQGCQSGSDDQVLEAMLSLDNFRHIFDKVLSQPNESDLIKTFGLGDS